EPRVVDPGGRVERAPGRRRRGTRSSVPQAGSCHRVRRAVPARLPNVGRARGVEACATAGGGGGREERDPAASGGARRRCSDQRGRSVRRYKFHRQGTTPRAGETWFQRERDHVVRQKERGLPPPFRQNTTSC